MQYSDPNAGLFGDGSPYGNVGMPYMGGQTGRRMGGRRRRGCLGCLVPLLIVVAIFAILNFGFGLTFHWGATTIQVDPNPTLIVESVANAHATIHIHASRNNGQIVIQPARPLNIPVGLAEDYQETNDHRTVIYNLGINTGGLFDITVPAQINLNIDTNDAAIVVDGITGHMHLETLSGSLTVKSSAIIGPSVLRSNSGTVQAVQDHFNGQIVADNNKGDITLQGTLDPAGIYRLTNNGGAITLTLTPNPAIQINASVLNDGSINSNIPGVKAQTTTNGFTLQTSLGTTPRAQLTLYNNGGDITINE